MPSTLTLYLHTYSSIQGSSTGTVIIRAANSSMSSSPWRSTQNFPYLPSTLDVHRSFAHIGVVRTIRSVEAQVERKFAARTPLGKKLVEIRERAIAAGMKLLTEAQITEEIESRRGEQPNGKTEDIR